MVYDEWSWLNEEKQKIKRKSKQKEQRERGEKTNPDVTVKKKKKKDKINPAVRGTLMMFTWMGLSGNTAFRPGSRITIGSLLTELGSKTGRKRSL